MISNKYIHQFKAGDVVSAHGAKFRVSEDARESNGHRPQSSHLVTAPGPCDVAVAKSVCIGGIETPGYIRIGGEWTFQGSYGVGQYKTESPTE